MKHVDEYRDPGAARSLAERIARAATRPWTLMEVCGGQTHAIVKHGIDRLLPRDIELIHGPGCPVCVTPIETIDAALAIAARPGVTFCSFGDMLRVPGSRGDLLRAKAEGADVRVVYSPLDAVAIARRSPEREVVFFAIGFETTAPATAMAVLAAHRSGIRNFSILAAHVLVPPALAAILQAPGCRIQGFLGPGHVCTVTGAKAYEAIARRFGVPIVIAGFEPVDLLQGILRLVELLEEGSARVENAYARVVAPTGNPAARSVVDEVYEACDRPWRGMGLLQKSGLRLRYELREHDASARFDVAPGEAHESPLCISGQILRGLKKPPECPAFGGACTPETPLGATMVSSEGACAAYHAFRGSSR
ncbi:MAG: hydrogenase formation protein HypD [Acidobacteriota bacterium]